MRGALRCELRWDRPVIGVVTLNVGTTMNQKYEYRTLALKVTAPLVLRGRHNELDESLQRMGSEGWKLVSVWPIPNTAADLKNHYAVHYFERQLDPAFA